MKLLSRFLVAALLVIPPVAKAINIDGVLDAQYGSAVVTQQLNTSTSDNTEGLIGQANGTELDAAYGVVSNGYLYLFLAGNLDSDDVADNITFDKLHIFFMTGPGGDHTLGTNYNNAADFGRLNRMGVGGNGDPNAVGQPGLTFDTNFAPNYWVGVTLGGLGAGPTMYLNYEVICSNCGGAFLGSTVPSNGPPNNVFLDGSILNGNTGILAAMSDSNINGVVFSAEVQDVSTDCNASPTAHPESVTTGVELAIPLSAIGNPTGKVTVCAFVTDDGYVTVYNQVLGTITSNACQGSFGESTAVNFGSLTGQHSFTFSVPDCNSFPPTPTTASYDSTGGVGSVFVANVGGCSWTATSGQPWVTITGSPSGTGNGTFTYSVGTNNTVDIRTAYIAIGGPLGTSTVAVTESGKILPPFGSIAIDGIAELSAYGCPIAVQQIGTQFGDNIHTNLQNNGGGSELDAAYGLVKDGVLYLVLAGNLENNFNRLNVFFMTRPGGLNTLTNVNPGVDFNHLNFPMGASTNGRGPGLTFDAGFAPNYFIGFNGGGTPYKLFVDFAELWPGSTNSLGVATNGYQLGSTASTNATLTAGFNPFSIQATINNSNTNGVDGGTCNTNVLGAAESIAAAQVQSGVEIAIPLAAFGNPTGTIAVCAFINSGDDTFLSNQLLGPLGSNPPPVVCQGNLGGVTNTAALNLGTFPGQHFFYVGPEMGITSVSRAGTAVSVNYQTENNPNFSYRLERTTGSLTTNSVWAPVTGFTPGTGGIITGTDAFGATNKPDALYRVRQSPGCQP